MLSNSVVTPEEIARQEIDRQLGVAGWIVIAPGGTIRASPTALCELSGDSGRADYVLYLDGKACGNEYAGELNFDTLVEGLDSNPREALHLAAC